MKSTKIKEPKIVWHYTRMNVLEKIFPPKGNEKYKKGEITLRFTNYKFLKDHSEGLILKEFFNTNRKSILENLSPDLQEKINGKQFRDKLSYSIFSYVFSTTHLKDSFAFWNKEYAGWNGVAIGIKLASIPKLKSDNYMFPDKVKYVDTDIETKLSKDLIKKIAEYLNISNGLYEMLKDSCKTEADRVFFSKNNSILDILLIFFSNMYKHKSWEYEKEARITTLESNLQPLETEFCDDKVREVGYRTFNKSIVSSIMLGPDCNEEQVNAIKGYLDKNEYNDIPVSRSHAFDSLDRRLLRDYDKG